MNHWPARTGCVCLSLILACVASAAPAGAEVQVGARDEGPRVVKAWTKHVIADTGAKTSTAVASDFDGDGHIDVMCSYAAEDSAKVALYRGPNWEKTIVLSAMPLDWTGRSAKRGCITSTLMDVDGDGDMDYIGSNRMLFWLECPDRPFEQPWPMRMISVDVNGAHDLHAADVDRDGRIDLIASSWRGPEESVIPNSITWFRVPQNVKQRAEVWMPEVLADRDATGRIRYFDFADIDRDGRGDVSAASAGSGTIAWWRQPKDATAAWTRHLVGEGQPGSTNIINADLNGDGHLDLLVSRGWTQGVFWYKGPAFERAIEIDPDIVKPNSLEVGDIDGDGDMDFATCSATTTGETAWYENDGRGNFTKHVIDTKQGSYDTRLIDMDGDGDLDIFIGGNNSNNVVWYENPLDG